MRRRQPPMPGTKNRQQRKMRRCQRPKNVGHLWRSGASASC
uniref:Uncharacterized protein n=1 Tax=Arundo donax TaxID=35708 RepID=A0A0A9CPG0_ARUDO